MTEPDPFTLKLTYTVRLTSGRWRFDWVPGDRLAEVVDRMTNTVVDLCQIGYYDWEADVSLGELHDLLEAAKEWIRDTAPSLSD